MGHLTANNGSFPQQRTTKGGRASVKEGPKAVHEAQQAGIEVNGFFLLGLSGDTEETMNDTIEFARSLAHGPA
jgi:hypothetical protein